MRQGIRIRLRPRRNPFAGNNLGVGLDEMHPQVTAILAGRKGEKRPLPSESCTHQRWRVWQELDPESKTINRGGIRHSFITRLRESGFLMEAKDLARHSQPAMTDHYTHPDNRALISALENLGTQKATRRSPR